MPFEGFAFEDIRGIGNRLPVYMGIPRLMS
jgi:hypothetical protein